MNISFLTEKLLYAQICGTKVGPPYKKRRPSGSTQRLQVISNGSGQVIPVMSSLPAGLVARNDPHIRVMRVDPHGGNINNSTQKGSTQKYVLVQQSIGAQNAKVEYTKW